MQHAFLDWILEQKTSISGNTGEIQMKSIAQLIALYQCSFLSFHYTMFI